MLTLQKLITDCSLDGYGNDTALIFYPGAKVEYTSYLPMLSKLASESVDCYLVKMPFNFALLGENRADSIIDTGNYSHYFISSHSLGGYVASSYLAHTNKSEGLILLASYPTEKNQQTCFVRLWIRGWCNGYGKIQQIKTVNEQFN